MSEWSSTGRSLFKNGREFVGLVDSADDAASIVSAVNGLEHARIGAEKALNRERLMHQQMERIRAELQDIWQCETSLEDADTRLEALLSSWPNDPQPTEPAPIMVRVTLKGTAAGDYAMMMRPGVNYTIPLATSVTVDLA